MRHFPFRKSQRIRKKSEFEAVFQRRQRAFSGPLGLYVAPNMTGRSRLGIAMSRKVGSAVRRNRIKRLLREAFRLNQHALPPSWDLVIVPRPHEPMDLAGYAQLLDELIGKALQKDRG